MNKDQKILFKTTFFGILFIVYFYLIYKYFWSKGYITLNEINRFNVYQRFFQASIIALSVPLLLVIKYHNNISELGFTNKSKFLTLILFIIYILFFILHSDYSVAGFYRAIHYLLFVGFSEEIIMRGYLYLRIKPVNRALAIIISGIIFGVCHAIVPGIVAGKSVVLIGLDMLSYIGGGIISGLFFILCMELSGTILVAILIHALLDYSYEYYGVLVVILTLTYLGLKNKSIKKQVNYETSEANIDKTLLNHRGSNRFSSTWQHR